MQVYVDESKAKAYLLAAVMVPPGNLTKFRRIMKSFLMPGQGHIHFVNEKDSRRKQILSALNAAGVQARIYRVEGLNPIVARAVCLEALMDDLVELEVTSLTLELEESARNSDVVLLRQGLERRGLRAGVEYRHLGKSAEPILWIADALAWSYARGGDFRRRALLIVQIVKEITG